MKGFGIKPAVADFIVGLRSGYPICCVLQFCFDTLLGNAEAMTFRYVPELEFTPCLIHEKIHGQTKRQAKRQSIRDGNIDIRFFV